MALEKEVFEMTEKQFKSLDYTPLAASMILPISERNLIKIVGEQGRLTYLKMMELGRKRGMFQEQIREKILKTCNYAIVPEKKAEEPKKVYVQGNLFDNL